jgi:hypothetical protein
MWNIKSPPFGTLYHKIPKKATKEDNMKKKILPASDLDKFLNKGCYGYDTLGSYTGVPAVPEDLPIQDADDL